MSERKSLVEVIIVFNIMWHTSAQKCIGSSEKSVGLWYDAQFSKHIQNVPRCIQCHHSTDTGARRNPNLLPSGYLEKKQNNSFAFPAWMQAFPLAFRFPVMGKTRKQTISYLLLKALSQCLLKFLFFPLSLHIVLLQPVNLPLGAFWSFVFLILIKIFSYLSETGRTWGITKYSLYFSGSSVCYQLSSL